MSILALIVLPSIVLALTATAWTTPAAAATELVMFEERGCPWCRKWRQEVGPAYPNSPEGKRAPLRVIDIHGPTPRDIALSVPVRATPTFVLIDNKREVGRITGYPGEDFFWALLGELIKKLPQDRPTTPDVRPIGLDLGHAVSRPMGTQRP